MEYKHRRFLEELVKAPEVLKVDYKSTSMAEYLDMTYYTYLKMIKFAKKNGFVGEYNGRLEITQKTFDQVS